MILQALLGHYEDLVAAGELSRPGWSESKISFALCLDESGEINQVLSLQTQSEGKNKKMLPRGMILPAPVKRASNIAPNFMWDNSKYILGVDKKGDLARNKSCFDACRSLHEQLLSGIDSTAAKAVLAHFQTWQPEKAQEHPAIAEYWEDLISGANLVFYVDGAFAQDDELVRSAWQQHYDVEEGERAVCLVTGQNCVPQKVHPAIKGVWDAQSSGAALISFNADAFCSYGKEQNLNAPMGKYASFAYTSALNHLLADRERVRRIGDTTVVCWAKGGLPGFQDAFNYFAFGDESYYELKDLHDMLKKVCTGQHLEFNEQKLDPEQEFYVLGISPNAARLSVRFFLRNSFGGFIKNINAHYERLEMVRPAYEKFPDLPPWRLLGETVNNNSRDKKPSPEMAGALMWAILTDGSYPASLLNGVMLRVRAEHEFGWGRASIVKAYFLKNRHPKVPEEVLTVSLNKDCTNMPYLLGRLFSVLEDIQEAANPGLNSTIKDRYFNSAAATPNIVFPTLIKLSQNHMRKLDTGMKVNKSKQISEIMGLMDEPIPSRLSLPEQCDFMQGYYHQTQYRFTKKEDK